MNRHANIMTSIMSTIISGQIHHQDGHPPHMGQGPNQLSGAGFWGWASARAGTLAALPRTRKIASFRHIGPSVVAANAAAAVLDGEQQT